MKLLLLLFFLGLINPGFSQVKDELKDTLEAKGFWADNIQNIIELNEEKILAQTNFPLRINDEWITEEQFKTELNKHFNPQVRSELMGTDFLRLKAWYIGDDNMPTYMVPCLDGLEKQYLSVVFTFSQFDGKWKLKEISYIESELYKDSNEK